MVLKAVLLSVATAAVAFLVTRSTLFEPLRKLTGRLPFFGELFDCCYCFSHWVAVALVIAYRVKLFDLFSPLDYLLTILAVAWTASFQCMAYDRLLGEE